MQRGILSLLAVLLLAALSMGQSLDDLTRPVPGRRMRASSTDLSGINRDHAVIEPGQKITVAELFGPGEIRHIWFTVSSRDYRYPASAVLRIYWDDAAEPSVETPLGDFFCAGHGMRVPVNSGPVQVSAEGRAYNCFWRMPFKRKAKIEVENQSSYRMTALYYYIDWLLLDAPPADSLYFHARYRQERPHDMAHDYTILETSGTGQYVGTVLSCQNSFNGWFGEGDDRIYIDGETTPRLTGTGTEDYFSDAWGFREFTYPDYGVPIFEGREIDSRITAYRWHVQDPIPFTQSLRVQIENKGWIFKENGDLYTGFGDRMDNYSSVAYWYQSQPAVGLPPLPPREQRMDPEVWYNADELVEGATVSTRGTSRVYSDRIAWGGRFAELAGASTGDWVQFPLRTTERGRYSLAVGCILMPQGGLYQVLLDGRVVEPRLDFYNHAKLTVNDTARKLVERKLGLHYLEPGPHQLRFVCIGRSPDSYTPGTGDPGYDVGVDTISLRKIAFENMDQRLPPLPPR